MPQEKRSLSLGQLKAGDSAGITVSPEHRSPRAEGVEGSPTFPFKVVVRA